MAFVLDENKQGSVQEREEREQQCKDQVDFGLMRMERLKEENAAATAATVASPPVSFAGSMGVPQMVMRQVRAVTCPFVSRHSLLSYPSVLSRDVEAQLLQCSAIVILCI